MSDRQADLAAAVGAAPPDDLAAVPAEHRAALAALVESAATRRAKLMDEAIEESLRHLPALLRATVRRTLGV